MRVFRFFPATVVVASAATLALSVPLLAKPPGLPERAPVPAMSRPDPRPPSEDVPIPAPRPARAPDKEKQPPATAPKEKKAVQPDPRSSALPADAMPAEEIACRERLEALGVVFEDRKAEHDAAVGCSVPYPVVVKKLGAALDVEPAAELNCPMAEALAKFMQDVVAPAAKDAFGVEPKSVAQASAFVCRPRHDGGKLSEHAFGNALDIAGFALADGTRVEVGPAPPGGQAKFLAAVRSAACGPFRTVLGPGSDPDHERHLHLDLEPRRHNGTFCQ